MPDWILKYWMQWLFGIITAGLSTVVGYLYKKVKKEVDEQKLIKEGVLALLHDRLYQACMSYIAQDEITVSGLKNLEYLYRSYHDLGGNGTGTELFESCKRLKKVPDGTHIKKGELS